MSTLSSVYGNRQRLLTGCRRKARNLFFKRRNGLRKDHFVGGTEVVEIFKPAIRVVAVLRAASVTNRLVLADLALRMRQGLLGGELVPLLAAGNLGPGVE